MRKNRAKRNPHGLIDFDKNIMQDAIRMSEYRFHKPINRFEKPEFDYLWRLYNKAADQRLSLKIYPDRSNPIRRKRSKGEKACEKKAMSDFAQALLACREPVHETWTNPTIDKRLLVEQLHQFKSGIVGFFVILFVASVRGGKIDKLVRETTNALNDSRAVLVELSAALLSMPQDEREELLREAFEGEDLSLVRVPAPSNFREYVYLTQFVKNTDPARVVNKLAKGEQWLDIYQAFISGFDRVKKNPRRRRRR